MTIPVGKKSLSLTLSFIFLFSLSFSLYAKDKKDDVEKIKKKISEKEKIIRKLKSKEVSILSHIGKISKDINENSKKLNNTKKSKTKVVEKINALKNEVSGLQQDTALLEKKLSLSLSDSYKMGRSGFLKVLLSSENYSEFSKKKYYLENLIKTEDQLLRDYGEKKNALDEKIDDLNSKEKQLSSLSKDIDSKLKAIKVDKQARLAVLRVVKSERELELKRAQELKKAAVDLENMIKKMKRSYSKDTLGFILKKGELEKPVNGKVVRGFGRHLDRELNVTTYSKGMVFRTQEGATVKSVFDGSVIFAGAFRGYGNMAIVNHGGNYYSLYARLSELKVSVGQKIKTGDVLGEMGSEEIDGEGLYFEIRHNGVAQDPAVWVKK